MYNMIAYQHTTNSQRTYLQYSTPSREEEMDSDGIFLYNYNKQIQARTMCLHVEGENASAWRECCGLLESFNG